jgi:hypothetical protein
MLWNAQLVSMAYLDLLRCLVGTAEPRRTCRLFAVYGLWD